MSSKDDHPAKFGLIRNCCHGNALTNAVFTSRDRYSFFYFGDLLLSICQCPLVCVMFCFCFHNCKSKNFMLKRVKEGAKESILFLTDSLSYPANWTKPSAVGREPEIKGNILGEMQCLSTVKAAGETKFDSNSQFSNCSMNPKLWHPEG